LADAYHQTLADRVGAQSGADRSSRRGMRRSESRDDSATSRLPAGRPSTLGADDAQSASGAAKRPSLFRRASDWLSHRPSQGEADLSLSALSQSAAAAAVASAKGDVGHVAPKPVQGQKSAADAASNEPARAASVPRLALNSTTAVAAPSSVVTPSDAGTQEVRKKKSFFSGVKAALGFKSVQSKPNQQRPLSGAETARTASAISGRFGRAVDGSAGTPGNESARIGRRQGLTLVTDAASSRGQRDDRRATMTAGSESDPDDSAWSGSTTRSTDTESIQTSTSARSTLRSSPPAAAALAAAFGFRPSANRADGLVASDDDAAAWIEEGDDAGFLAAQHVSTSAAAEAPISAGAPRAGPQLVSGCPHAAAPAPTGVVEAEAAHTAQLTARAVVCELIALAAALRRERHRRCRRAALLHKQEQRLRRAEQQQRDAADAARNAATSHRPQLPPAPSAAAQPFATAERVNGGDPGSPVFYPASPHLSATRRPGSVLLPPRIHGAFPREGGRDDALPTFARVLPVTSPGTALAAYDSSGVHQTDASTNGGFASTMTGSALNGGSSIAAADDGNGAFVNPLLQAAASDSSFGGPAGKFGFRFPAATGVALPPVPTGISALTEMETPDYLPTTGGSAAASTAVLGSREFSGEETRPHLRHVQSALTGISAAQASTVMMGGSSMTDLHRAIVECDAGDDRAT
jgi:hypothetical protein